MRLLQSPINDISVITGAALYDGEAQLRSGLSVVIKDGHIIRICPDEQVAADEGRRINLQNCTILPGLIDCHVHLTYRGEANLATTLFVMPPGEVVMRALESAQETLAGGVTAVRDCGGRDHLEIAVRNACNSGRQLGPTIRAAGRFICMTGGHGRQVARVADGPDDVRKAVREEILAGVDVIKLIATGGVMTPGSDPSAAQFTQEEMNAGVAEAKRHKRTTASHAMGAGGIMNAVRAGIDSIEHGCFMDEECIEAMIALKTFYVPTLSTWANIIANAHNGLPAATVERAKWVLDATVQSLGKIHARGGRIAMGTDAGTPYTFHGDNAHELRLMVDAGMSTVDVLNAATVNAADLVGLSDRGRLEVGMVADMLVVSGDPVSDIEVVTNRENHRLLFKNGGVVASSPSLDRDLLC